MVIFNSYVKLPEGNTSIFVSVKIHQNGRRLVMAARMDRVRLVHAVPRPSRLAEKDWPRRRGGEKPSRGDVAEFTKNGDMVGMAMAWPVV